MRNFKRTRSQIAREGRILAIFDAIYIRDDHIIVNMQIVGADTAVVFTQDEFGEFQKWCRAVADAD